MAAVPEDVVLPDADTLAAAFSAAAVSLLSDDEEDEASPDEVLAGEVEVPSAAYTLNDVIETVSGNNIIRLIIAAYFLFIIVLPPVSTDKLVYYIFILYR